MQYVDLHCHSTASDGTLSPRDVVKLAKASELSGLALTDHDTIAGIADAADEAGRLGIDFLSGIEISCMFKQGTMHLLGYGVDPQSPELAEMTESLIHYRDARNPRIVEKLQALNVDITMAEVLAQAAGGVVGRPHIAAVLLRKGYVSSIKQAFNEYLATDAKAYVDKERLGSRDAIRMIHEAGGVAVLAHAIQLKTQNDAELDTIIKNLVDQGLDGLEVIHSDHDAGWIDKCRSLCDRYSLLPTGGSDFHGSHKVRIALGVAGGKRIPRAWFDQLRSAIAKRKP